MKLRLCKFSMIKELLSFDSSKSIEVTLFWEWSFVEEVL